MSAGLYTINNLQLTVSCYQRVFLPWVPLTQPGQPCQTLWSLLKGGLLEMSPCPKLASSFLAEYLFVSEARKSIRHSVFLVASAATVFF